MSIHKAFASGAGHATASAWNALEQGDKTR
jgi:hypothetical protein